MIDKLIGNTPMVKIKYEYKGKKRNVYAKLEYYNYTGSIKDRLAMYILKESKKRGLLKEGQIIVEATSGNTGISFAAIGRLLGHEVHIFMPRSASMERRRLLKLYGATIHLVNSGFEKAILSADKFAKKNNGFRPDQFNNAKNIDAHYFETGSEILKEVPNVKGFVSGIGTGGTLTGIGRRLKDYNKNIKVIALEPSTMPLLSGGKIIGPHNIEGIGDDFIPSIVDRDIIDEVMSIDDKEAIKMSRLLARTFGLGVGISSGANLLAAIRSDLNNVVTVFADDAKKYLSTNLLNNIDSEKIEFKDIKLLSIESI